MMQLHFICGLLIFVWLIGTYATYNSLIDNNSDRESGENEWWIKLIILIASLLFWPYPVIYNAVKLGKL